MTVTPASPASPLASTPTVPTFRIPAPQGTAPAPTVPVSRSTYLRRRIAVVIGVMIVALALVLTSDAISAEAGGDAPASAGHVVVQPGQTLWDIAAVEAPAGMDVRAYLLQIEQLNGIRAHGVAAWDVVLLPIAR